jgi:hypothetical protein
MFWRDLCQTDGNLFSDTDGSIFGVTVLRVCFRSKSRTRHPTEHRYFSHPHSIFLSGIPSKLRNFRQSASFDAPELNTLQVQYTPLYIIVAFLLDISGDSYITQRITPTRQTCDGPLGMGQIKSHARFLHLVYRSSDGVQMITVQGNVNLKRSRTEASSPNPPSKKASALKHLEVSTTMALPSPKLHISASLDTMPRSIAAGLAAYTHTHLSLHSRTSTNYEASNHTMVRPRPRLQPCNQFCLLLFWTTGLVPQK